MKHTQDDIEHFKDLAIAAIYAAQEERSAQIRRNTELHKRKQNVLEAFESLEFILDDDISELFPKLTKPLTACISHVREAVDTEAAEFARYEREYGILEDGSVVISYTDIGKYMGVTSITAKKYIEQLVFEGKLAKTKAYHFWAYRVV